MAQKWIADCPISLPAGTPINRPVQVDLGGFQFTTGGICLEISAVQFQDLLNNLYAPPEA